MKKSDLNNLSVAKLMELDEWVQDAIGERQAEEKESLKAKMEAMAAASGLSVADIFGKGKRGGKRGPVAVKYRHPKDPSLTWTGRGRMPNWMKDAGGKPERFLIK